MIDLFIFQIQTYIYANVACYAFGFMLTFMIESPLMNLEKMLMKGRSNTDGKKTNKKLDETLNGNNTGFHKPPAELSKIEVHDVKDKAITIVL